MDQSELGNYVKKAFNELKQSDYGQMILNNAHGKFFDISAENIHITPPGRRAGRCYKEISSDGNAEDKITLSTEVLERDKSRPLTTEEDRVKGLACLLAHELSHARQYNANPEIIPVEDKRQKPQTNKYISHEKWIRGLSQDCVMEADARAASFLIMQLCKASPWLRSHMKNTEQNDFYMPQHKFDSLSRLNHHTLALSANLRQKIAREAFRSILETTARTIPEFKENMLRQKGKDTAPLKEKNKLELNFNYQESLAAIKSAYHPEIYGDISLFLDTIPGLSSDNRQLLTEELTAQKSAARLTHTPIRNHHNPDR